MRKIIILMLTLLLSINCVMAEDIPDGEENVAEDSGETSNEAEILPEDVVIDSDYTSESLSGGGYFRTDRRYN